MSTTMTEIAAEVVASDSKMALVNPPIEAFDFDEVQDASRLSGIKDVTEELTKEEKRKIQEAWAHLGRLCGEDVYEKSIPDMSNILKPLLQMSPGRFREELWCGALPDNPDAAVLRFLRARKWDVQKAMEMLVSTINWRVEHRIRENIIGKGESLALKESMTADEKAFLAQYRSGKSYVRATDKEGRPIYVIKVRLHDPKAQSNECMENYTLHGFESIKSMVTYPNDKVCLIFDMNGFGLKNMDFHVIKFLVQVFEARYPETLGIVLIHKAPYIFWGVWRIIKSWLDPVIAAKINFTYKSADLLRFIQAENLQEEYGGTDAWKYQYIEPSPGENSRMKDEKRKAEIRAEQEKLVKQYEQETRDWLTSEIGSDESKAKLSQRLNTALKLRDSFWLLDPYVRSRTYYHRAGVIGPKGEVDVKAAGVVNTHD